MSIPGCLWNLVACINMSAYHLRKPEVAYELKIRKLPTEGTADQLRKRLSQAMASNTDIDDGVVNALDTSAELDTCEAMLQDLSTMVQDYEGNFGDNEYHRLLARLWHLYLRVERIPVGASADNEDEDAKKGLLVRVKEVIDNFKAPEAVPEDIQEINKNTVLSADQLDSGPLARGTQEQIIPSLDRYKTNYSDKPAEKTVLGTHQLVKSTASSAERDTNYKLAEQSPSIMRPRYVPVYKWGLTFDNTGPSIASFLERVEELRRARGVTHQELFESAVDLFSGAALVWYRSSAGRIKSWTHLCKELKEVFQPPDYDFRLHHEIFNRFQGEKESIDLYVAAMEGLYARLSTPVPEPSRLAQIFNNLHPQLQDRLALVDIRTLDDLRTMGRRVEAGRLRHARPRPPTGQGSSLEPDLAYQDLSCRRSHPTGRAAAIQGDTTREQPARVCWNCGMKGHSFVTCRKPRKKFCYGCGRPDVIRRDCSECSQKNGQRWGPVV